MENNTPQNNVSLWNKIKIAFGTLLVLFVLTLIICNWFDVPLNLVFKTIDVPFAVIVILSLFTGYIWGTIATHRRMSKSNTKKRSSGVDVGNE